MSDPEFTIHDCSEFTLSNSRSAKEWSSLIRTVLPLPGAVPISLEALKAIKDKFPAPLEKVEIVTADELAKLRAAAVELSAIKQAWGMSPEVSFVEKPNSRGLHDAREAQFNRLQEENTELRELLCQSHAAVIDMKAEIQRLRNWKEGL
jgi:hypothetical protein